MSLLVFECGAVSPEPAIAAAREFLARKSITRMSVVRPAHESEMVHEDTSLPFEKLLEQLTSGAISSVVMFGDRPQDGFISIEKPDFAGDKLHLWYTYAEYDSKYDIKLLEPLKGIDGLLFVSIALEDTLDLENMETISTKNFPWDHWRLLCAAVRRPDGAWEQRLGPAATNG